MKKVFINFIILIFGFTLVGCVNEIPADIYASIYPVEFLVNEIVKGELVVKPVYPKGQDIHEYDITTRTMTNMANSKAIFYVGLNLEPTIILGLNTVFKDTNMVSLTNGMENLLDSDGDVHQNSQNEDNIHFYDPHVWLNPQMMQQMASIILDEVIKIEPSKSDFFQKNFNILNNKLKDLDEKFFDITNDENIISKTIMVDHNAYAYWIRYGIKSLKIRQSDEGSETTVEDFQKIVEYAKENNIKYLVATKNVAEYENLIDRIVKEINGEKVYLHNLATITVKESNNGEDYFTIMEDNIEVLRNILPRTNS